MATTRHSFELFPGYHLCVAILVDADAEAIEQARAARNEHVALLNPSLVASPLALRVAANKALAAFVGAQAGLAKMKAQNVANELVYCLHASRNIGESLRIFGPRTDSREVLLCSFNEAAFHAVRVQLKGTTVPWGRIPVDSKALIEQYKISPEELALGSGPLGQQSEGAGLLNAIEQAVIGRIAIQDHTNASS